MLKLNLYNRKKANAYIMVNLCLRDAYKTCMKVYRLCKGHGYYYGENNRKKTVNRNSVQAGRRASDGDSGRFGAGDAFGGGAVQSVGRGL